MSSLTNDLNDDSQEDSSIFFENLSLEYKFRSTEGVEVEDVCLNNSKVAHSYNLCDTSLVWNQLKDLALELKQINQCTIVENDRKTQTNPGVLSKITASQEQKNVLLSNSQASTKGAKEKKHRKKKVQEDMKASIIREESESTGLES